MSPDFEIGMKLTFLISEGEATSQKHWKWNQTLGPLTERPGRPGTWGYENTDGLGLVEYLHVSNQFNFFTLLTQPVVRRGPVQCQF